MAHAVGVARIAMELAAVYYDSIDKGQAPSTKRGKAYAHAYFAAFLETLSLSYDDLTNATLTEVLFRQFATYLADYARDSRGDPLSLGTALQYFSGAKTKALADFPGLDIFQHKPVHDEWNVCWLW